MTSNTANTAGGGIYNYFGTLTVTNSLVSHNFAGNDGGGIVVEGGPMTLAGVTVSHNQSKFGGGILTSGIHPIKIVGSTLSDNTALDGGGLYNSGALSVTVVNSTLSNNDATNNGGGIHNAGPSLTIINSTLSDNFSDRNGAGIFNDILSDCCTVNLYNDTLEGNQANQAMETATGGGLFNTAGMTVTLQNTLLDGNTRATNAQDVFDDCSGTVTSLSYNLFSTTAGCLGVGPLDLKNVPGQTGPLQDNGGPTFTNALLPGSPAIDAGNPVACTDNLTVTLHTDQRGARRPANGARSTRCDIGAYELQRTLELPLVLK